MSDLVKQLSIKEPNSDTYITRDIGVKYQNIEGLDTDAETAKAKKATGDKNGKDITSYVSSVTLDNNDALKVVDGVPNAEGTTYQLAMQGATGLANGRRGFVPKPNAGDQNKVLKGDGTWSYSPANDSIAPAETSPAAAEHHTNSKIFFNGILYDVIDEIEIGDNLVVNTNIKASKPISDSLESALHIQDQICDAIEDGSTSEAAYSKGDYLVHNDVLYRVTSDIAIDDFLEGHITAVSVTDEIKKSKTLICNNIEDDLYSDGAYHAGEFFYRDGNLCKATKDIAVNDYLDSTDNYTQAHVTDIMVGATASTAGSSGLVPQPSSGDQSKVLKGDGTWSYSPANDNIAKKEVSPATAEHQVGDRIIFQGILYKVIDAIEIGDTLILDSNIEVSEPLADCIGKGSTTQDMICAYNEATTTSTHSYGIGDYFIYNDMLYRVTAPYIMTGDTIVPGTNCETTHITTEIDAGVTKIVKRAVGNGTTHTFGHILQVLLRDFPFGHSYKNRYSIVRVSATGASKWIYREVDTRSELYGKQLVRFTCDSTAVYRTESSKYEFQFGTSLIEFERDNYYGDEIYVFADVLLKTLETTVDATRPFMNTPTYYSHLSDITADTFYLVKEPAILNIYG